MSHEIVTLAKEYEARLNKHVKTGLGVMPSADPSDNFYNQLWARDFAHAALSYYIDASPEAVETSLRTIFSFQLKNGGLPFRIEEEYMLIKLIPGLKWFSPLIFDLVQRKWKHQAQRPVYPGDDFDMGSDTTLLIILAACAYATRSDRGRMFVGPLYPKLLHAFEHVAAKADLNTGLLVIPKGLVDWADSIRRGGKLGVINVLWVRALDALETLHQLYGSEAAMSAHGTLRKKAHASLMREVYAKEQGFFRTTAGEDRLDTVASILGSLFFLDAEEAARVQETIRARVARESGSQIFILPMKHR